MTRDQFIYGLTACGCLLKNGKTWYEHNELIKCFEDLGLLEQEPFINKPCISSGVCEHDKNDALNKIRAEIENHCGLVKENHCKYCSYCNSVMGVREILEVLDRYKAESENI